MKIYTGRGDAGQTSTWGGVRMDKDSPRLEALGQVDACSADIGVAIAAGLPEVLVVALGDVQDDLYIVGCVLMAPDTAGSGASVPRLTGAEVERLETLIDDFTARMPELKKFIHPAALPAQASSTSPGPRAVARNNASTRSAAPTRAANPWPLPEPPRRSPLHSCTVRQPRGRRPRSALPCNRTLTLAPDTLPCAHPSSGTPAPAPEPSPATRLPPTPDRRRQQ